MKKNAGIKHLVECHCILPQFKKKEPPVYHKFTVYSKILGKSEKIEEKFIKCNNCDTLHKIVDVCRSEIVIGKDDYSAGLTIEDMSYQLDSKISNLLSVNNCDYATWEHVIDIIDDERWNESIVIKREIVNDKLHVKVLKILAENKIRINSKVIEDEIVGEGTLWI